MHSSIAWQNDADIQPQAAGQSRRTNNANVQVTRSEPSLPTTSEQPAIDGAARVRYDQPALASASTIYASSISHDRTTQSAYSSMISQADGQNTREKQGREYDEGASVYSYNSFRDINNYVKELHGRIFNNLNDAYLLPSDRDEWARLDKQGSAIAIGFGGLYPCPEVIDAVLLPEEGGRTKRILDIGCGTGTWAIQMANKFPHTSVLGVDLAPPPVDRTSLPPNLSLEIDDVNYGLRHFSDQFDLVHMRCVSGGITNIDQTLLDLQNCLRPGGVLLIVDGDISILSEDRKTLQPFKRLPGDGGPEVTSVSEQGSWFRRLLWEACVACEISGACLTRTDEVNDLGLWDAPLCDPETACSGGIDLPIGPWPRGGDLGETQLLQYVGILMRQNLSSIHRAYHGIMLKAGMDQATLDEWSNNVEKELRDLNPRMWLRFRFMMARRRAGENLPAPPLPTVQTPDLSTSAAQELEDAETRRRTRVQYPAMDIYHTREENMARMRQRRSTFGVFPTSAVQANWDKIHSES
ncbi:hypothetical protein M408DRAFT_204621 [Serendipita vermifera MAFF 305830]|uniref:Methyltransferase domain-containing protein n=1 Tax=Serendipita vermifera MAFF 305830 TaxID=933852 RepID=A0A0C2X9B8_SERVB|nr:hypothetical protein M408DRAFT_204621 [Serendipita vermifera MAFF 305830]